MSSTLVKSLTKPYELLRVSVNSASLVCVAGQPSVGKTKLVETFFDDHKDKFIGAYINCLEITTSSQLHHNICNSLLESLPTEIAKDEREELYQSTSDLDDFYSLYHKLVTAAGYVRVYLILDHVDVLKRVSMTDSLIFLSVIPHLNCIWISTELPHSILGAITNNSALSKLQDRLTVIVVTPWGKPDLVEVTLRQRPPGFNYEIYKRFVQSVVSTLYVDKTRDVNEINTFCLENFKNFLDLCYEKDIIYVEDDGEVIINNSKLTALTAGFVAHFQSGTTNYDDSSDGYSVHSSMRILLVAIYIAAHTKHSDDKYNFVKFQKRKSRSRPRTKEIISDSQTFSLERVAHIYRKLALRTYGYNDELAAGTLPDSLFGDLLYLRDLRYVQVVVGDGISSATRLKLARPLNYNYVDRLAQSCGLRLYEFSGLPGIN